MVFKTVISLANILVSQDTYTSREPLYLLWEVGRVEKVKSFCVYVIIIHGRGFLAMGGGELNKSILLSKKNQLSEISRGRGVNPLITPCVHVW